jgi:hypothetical protein
MTELDKLRAEVEYQIEQAMAIDWNNPKNLNPIGVALCNQMAVAKIMMRPQNQMALWRAMWGIK